MYKNLKITDKTYIQKIISFAFLFTSNSFLHWIIKKKQQKIRLKVAVFFLCTLANINVRLCQNVQNVI